ncbi:MAG: hypothetical protein E5W49_11950 [Mesorhizobium sp.]|nr:MAG: hypothetical protein E5W49_11950 [Mesorhizobium sp.]
MVGTASASSQVPEVLGRHVDAIGILVGCHHHCGDREVQTLRDGGGGDHGVELAQLHQPFHQDARVVGQSGVMQADALLQQPDEFEIPTEFLCHEIGDEIDVGHVLGSRPLLQLFGQFRIFGHRARQAPGVLDLSGDHDDRSTTIEAAGGDGGDVGKGRSHLRPSQAQLSPRAQRNEVVDLYRGLGCVDGLQGYLVVAGALRFGGLCDDDCPVVRAPVELDRHVREAVRRQPSGDFAAVLDERRHQQELGVPAFAVDRGQHQLEPQTAALVR